MASRIIRNSSPASRRVFAKKARPSRMSIRMAYIPRGGGYL